jgi:hypothetical protein
VQVSPFYIVYKKSQNLWFGVYYDTLAPCVFDMGSETDACFGKWFCAGLPLFSGTGLYLDAAIYQTGSFRSFHASSYPVSIQISKSPPQITPMLTVSPTTSLITMSFSPMALSLPSWRRMPNLSSPSHPLHILISKLIRGDLRHRGPHLQFCRLSRSSDT